ncbi:3' terminal RNA ribose 2'-O-methyltransferase Hen1 [Bremerella sp. JC817]|uniref:3' terminal RNA ribose 2'-O-methyltransferase Hen1 n=1 Tax=Bremerella sp. JC817 TaxID=3231756 RepID=UPI003457D0BD
MLLSISTTHKPATDLSFLLHKHPDKFQSFATSFGKVHCFYPEASEERCTACLLLEVDPVGMARGRNRSPGDLLSHYVNDRSYVASSLMSVGISQVLGTALGGRCQKQPELVTQPLPLQATLDVLPVCGGAAVLRQLFEPLGYEVEATRQTLDAKFPEWGDSSYFSVTIRGEVTLSQLLTHLYVLIPVFDNEKHYFVGEAEVEKLLAKGEGWLADHPARNLITRRYLRFRSGLYHQALARLIEEEAINDEPPEETTTTQESQQQQSLNQQRHAAVLQTLMESDAKSVLDLGCGEGRLLRSLIEQKQFRRIVGVDVAIRTLEIASRRLKLERLPEAQAERVELIHGSLTYRDKRLEGFDAAAVVEVIEHLDPPRLAALQRVLFGCARPKTVVLTTPNQEFNVKWESLPAGQFRHADHRFEWTRPQFQAWANQIAETYGYTVTFQPVGPVDDEVGSPTQMGIFRR